jgi:hypothetical protein
MPATAVRRDREHGHGDPVPSARDRIVAIYLVRTAAATPRLADHRRSGAIRAVVYPVSGLANVTLYRFNNVVNWSDLQVQ